LFTTVPICPSFHAGSLIVARYLNRLLLSVSFFFLQGVKYLGAASEHYFQAINRDAIQSSQHFSRSARLVKTYETLNL